MILGGNMRYKALLELKYKEVPDTWVKRADNLTEGEKQRFILTDNSDFGEWDYDCLVNEYDVNLIYDCGVEIPSLGGDYIGGRLSRLVNTYKRKCMNTWFMSTDKPIKFVGRINEDYTTYISNGAIGDLFYTIPDVSIKQLPTQTNEGGMSDIYEDNGTYIKSFYSIIAMPSCVKISMMGDKHRRIHHRTDWNYAVPKLLRESK